MPANKESLFFLPAFVFLPNLIELPYLFCILFQPFQPAHIRQVLYLEVLKLNIKPASIGTGSHKPNLHRNIILQPCIPHHRISLVIERIEDFNGIQPADSFNPNIRNRFIQRDYTPVTGLVSHHCTQIEFSVYKLNACFV